MAQRLIHRPASSRPAEADLKSVDLIPPPSLPDAGAGLQGVMQILMPIMGGAGSVVMIVANKNPVMLIAGGIMIGATVIGAIVMFIAQRTGTTKRAADLRRRYLDYLDRVRTDLAGASDVQREIAVHHHPDPDALPEVARDPHAAVGAPAEGPGLPDGPGRHRLGAAVAAGDRCGARRDPLAEPDIVTAAAVLRITERDRMVGGMPVGLPISGRVSVVGPSALVRDTVTAALAQLVTLHGAEEVKVITCLPRRAAGWLDWLKWMPHCAVRRGGRRHRPAPAGRRHPRAAGRPAPRRPVPTGRRGDQVRPDAEAGAVRLRPGAGDRARRAVRRRRSTSCAGCRASSDPATVGVHTITLVDNQMQPARPDRHPADLRRRSGLGRGSPSAGPRRRGHPARTRAAGARPGHRRPPRPRPCCAA